MWKITGRGIMMLVVMTLLTGAAYPLIVTGLAQTFYPKQAKGSLLYRNGEPIGSTLIGQNFAGPGYFHGRPSAAGSEGYDATASSGSNLGPTNEVLTKNVAERAAKVREENHLPEDTPVPADLVTASASGLDPHISPEAALLQVPRVAGERNLPEAKVRKLVQHYTDHRQLGVLGEPRVNVLELNLALDTL